jgi:hypothetical protein
LRALKVAEIIIQKIEQSKGAIKWENFL